MRRTFVSIVCGKNLVYHVLKSAHVMLNTDWHKATRARPFDWIYSHWWRQSRIPLGSWFFRPNKPAKIGKIVNTGVPHLFYIFGDDALNDVRLSSNFEWITAEHLCLAPRGHPRFDSRPGPVGTGAPCILTAQEPFHPFQCHLTQPEILR